MNEFVIPVNGLANGLHRYSFRIGKEFFERIEYSEFGNGMVEVGLELEKENSLFTFNFSFSGSVEVVCDRCNDLFNLEINGKERLIVKGSKEEGEDDEIVYIPEETGQFDISHYLYEFISLLVPMRRVHPEDEEGISLCNPEVIKRLNQYSSHTGTDPRWDALKKLKDQ